MEGPENTLQAKVVGTDLKGLALHDRRVIMRIPMNPIDSIVRSFFEFVLLTRGHLCSVSA